VLETNGTTVTCTAMNSARLDGLLTVMICHQQDEVGEVVWGRWWCGGVCVVRQGALSTWRGGSGAGTPRALANIPSLPVPPSPCLPPPLQDFRADFGLPLLTDTDVECIKHLG
jgi:hypothetical protein